MWENESKKKISPSLAYHATAWLFVLRWCTKVNKIVDECIRFHFWSPSLKCVFGLWHFRCTRLFDLKLTFDDAVAVIAVDVNANIAGLCVSIQNSASLFFGANIVDVHQSAVSIKWVLHGAHVHLASNCMCHWLSFSLNLSNILHWNAVALQHTEMCHCLIHDE